MKKICLFLALFSLITLFCGCSPKEYQLVKKHGNYYIKLNKEFETSSSNDNSYIQEAAPLVGFDSIEEMVNDITNGDFTEDELRDISRFKTDDAGNILVCDLDSLYVPQFPNTYNHFAIAWSGSSYSFSIQNADGSKHCPFMLWDEAGWQAEFDKTQSWNTGVLRLEVTSTQTDTERDGTIYYFPYASFSSDGTIEYTPRKSCVYSFERNGNVYHIIEYYKTDATDAIPSNISIFGISQSQHFFVFISDPEERPTMDWIAQFGLQEYSAN